MKQSIPTDEETIQIVKTALVYIATICMELAHEFTQGQTNEQRRAALLVLEGLRKMGQNLYEMYPNHVPPPPPSILDAILDK